LLNAKLKMRKFKRKLIKGLSAFLLAGAFLFPKSQAQERVIIDNFSQPNDTTLNYYGSGDVFLDNKIDSLDTYRLDSIIGGTFTDPTDDRLTDRADINGDEVIDNQDKQTLDSLINGNINYLPSNWNKSNTAKKIDWFEKMVEIDRTDTIAPGTLCFDYSAPFAINFHGFESLKDVNPEDFPFKFSKNNRFNIPAYYVATTHITNQPHAINGVLIGDDPLNFNDWYFIEPQGDVRVYPGDWSMTLNKYVEVNQL